MPTSASFPFNKPTADVVLRSCDDVDFRVSRAILAEASPVFETMFQLSQPADGVSVNDVPVVQLTEDSQTIDRLLRVCYPIPDPPLEKLEDIVAVLRTFSS